MKIIIFSDTHLKTKFKRRKFEYLKKIITQADQVIINGDFWDGFIISFDKFVKSDWNKLFQILKSKKTVYLYGNHDKEKLCDKRTELFSDVQAESYELKTGKYNLHIQHGNKIYISVGDNYPWITNWFTCYFGLGARDLFMRILGEKLMSKIYPISRRTQKTLMKWSLENMYGNEIFVASHSHTPIFDMSKKYINTGFIGQTYASYIKINNGDIELIKERY